MGQFSSVYIQKRMVWTTQGKKIIKVHANSTLNSLEIYWTGSALIFLKGFSIPSQIFFAPIIWTSSLFLYKSHGVCDWCIWKSLGSIWEWVCSIWISKIEVKLQGCLSGQELCLRKLQGLSIFGVIVHSRAKTPRKIPDFCGQVRQVSLFNSDQNWQDSTLGEPAVMLFFITTSRHTTLHTRSGELKRKQGCRRNFWESKQMRWKNSLQMLGGKWDSQYRLHGKSAAKEAPLFFLLILRPLEGLCFSKGSCHVLTSCGCCKAGGQQE